MSYGDLSAGSQPVNVTLQAMKEVAQSTRQELYAERLTAREAFRTILKETVNPFTTKLRKGSKDKEAHLKRIQQMLKAEKTVKGELSQHNQDRAGDFQRRNAELKAQTLLSLREQIKPNDTKEEILKKAQDFYPDVTLADEALEFLLETTDGELRNEVLNAKNELNETSGREIAAGRNISEVARQAESLGTPTTMRELYRDITGTPRDSGTLFEELSKKYAFKQLKSVFRFLFHSLGTDLKSKGPSIAQGELHRLMQETRSLQAILGVYRFFAGRMRLVHRLFAKEGLQMPQNLNFEILAKQFMALCSERYPSSDKVLKLAKALGIDKWLLAQIIVYSQMRDAIREVAMNQIFRSLQHRDELYNAIIEALEDLEDEWEEKLEEEDDEEETDEEESEDDDGDDEEEEEEE